MARTLERGCHTEWPQFDVVLGSAVTNGLQRTGVSVFVALDVPVEHLCAEVDEVRRYGQVRLSTVGRLRQAGFTLLSTGRRPHYDIALPDLTGTTLEHLRHAFGPPVVNPGR